MKVEFDTSDFWAYSHNKLIVKINSQLSLNHKPFKCFRQRFYPHTKIISDISLEYVKCKPGRKQNTYLDNNYIRTVQIRLK